MAGFRWAERLETILVRRESVIRRVVAAALRATRPGVVDTRRAMLDRFESHRRVSVVAPSDADLDLFRRLQAGDHWVKHHLVVTLGALGYLVTDVDPDVVVHLFGGHEMRAPRRAVKIVWLYSFPERVRKGHLERYDRIFCASASFTEEVRSWGFAAETLWPATSHASEPRPLAYDVVFVGNARPDGRRRVVDDMGHPAYRFSVWGRGYRDLPSRYWAGPYVEHSRLDEIYGASLVSLNDHFETMAAEFLNPRVLDILAAGGFCVSDANPALTSLFGDAVPQYRRPAELRELVDGFRRSPEQRKPLMEHGRRIALEHTWPDVVRRLLHGLGPAWNGSA
ncbi:MAG: glycosyltransferase family 1 protein [Candidatus Rokubacteria bacterium]|nr:glycosyltransferase family 1 protein [Candidatus Rokubacteria bacterium]